MKNRLRRLPMKKLLQTTLLFALAFCAGRLAAQVVEYNRPPEAVTTSADGNWGLSFPGEGQMPVGNATADYLKQFNAYYAQNTQDKVIYLTFDAGYENGNTAAILDALKKHNVHATFFLVGNYLQTSPCLLYTSPINISSSVAPIMIPAWKSPRISPTMGAVNNGLPIMDAPNVYSSMAARKATIDTSIA